nr:glycosyltransferase family 4 protein [uncultured Flavobacterium sp.]
MTKNKIRILFIARATLYSSPGGDTIQVLKTAEYLEKFDLEVTINLSSKDINVADYDIVHFFNIIRPADILVHFKKAKKKVISTIFVDYSETEKNASNFLRKNLINLVGSYKVEYLKSIIKAILGKESIVSKEFIFRGQFNSMKFLYKNSDALLPNSLSELNRLKKVFGTTNALCEKVVNAIDINSNIIPNPEFIDAIICVGRIEKLKNQLNVIKAVNQLNLPLYIIGNPAINDVAYFEECKKIAGDKVKFIRNLPQNEVFSIMKAAKVHVLASWFETTGLVSLEAAYYGCNIVITDKGDQVEYFQNNAYYCKPNDIESIKKAVLKAYCTPYDLKFHNYIKDNLTWENTALQTKEVYLEILEKN